MAVGTIIVVAGLIKAVADATTAVINTITSIKGAINNIRTNEMQSVWKSVKNTDSQMFNTRMEELEVDIQKAYDILDEYEKLLRRSAAQYENTQQNVHGQATALKSPTRT